MGAIQAKDRLIVALDVKDIDAARQVVECATRGRERSTVGHTRYAIDTDRWWHVAGVSRPVARPMER